MKNAIRLVMLLAAMWIVSPASAAVSLIGWDLTPFLGNQVQATPAPIVGTVDVNITGSASGDYRDPWESVAACAGVCRYNSVRANSSATYSYAQDQSGLLMMWGSPDKDPVNWNVMEFFDNNVSQGIFKGDTISALLTGAPLFGTDGRGFIRLLFSGTWDKVVLTASKNAFEHVWNLSGSAIPEVPLPAGLLLLLSGLGGLGFMGRYRAKRAMTTI